MNQKILMQLLNTVYALLLRPLVEKAIADPNNDWDDVLMAMLDGMFRYNPASQILRPTDNALDPAGIHTD